MTAKPRIVPAAIAAVIAITILCALGMWQVQRLHWKEGLLADIAGKLAQPAIPFTSVPSGNTAEFTKVTAAGTYIPSRNRFVIAISEGGAGWQVVTPLVMDNNYVLLVDRGSIPDRELPAYRSENFTGPVEITGILRLRRDKPGAFTPVNDVAGNHWYWWDVPAMLASIELPQGVNPVAAVVQLLPDPSGPPLPKPQPPSANLANNHLGYALTWFGFAIILAVIAILFIRQQMNKSGA